MSDVEGVTAEPAEETAPEDVTVAVPETEDKGVEPETEVEEVQETVEDKLERLEREVNGKQKKIDRQTAANRATQEKYDAQRQEFEKLSASIAEQKPDAEPSINDYETHEEYNEAVKDYIRKEAVTEAQQGFLQEQQRVQHEQIMAERTKLRQSQEVEYLVENPMYKAASNEVETYINGLSNVSHIVMDAVASQLYDGNVPAVIDYFGSNDGENLAELGEISRMSPPRAAVEVYKIQQKILGSPVRRKELKPASAPAKRPKSSGKPIKDLHSGSVLKNLGLK